MKLYHLDRSGRLPLKQPVSLIPMNRLPPEVRCSPFLAAFPDGISNHGFIHLSNSCPYIHSYSIGNSKDALDPDSFAQEKSVVDSRIIEFDFELIRRLYFPCAPSRFTAFFAVEDPSEFEQWPEIYNREAFPELHVVEIDAPDDTPRFDSRLLKSGIAFGKDDIGYYIGCWPMSTFDIALQYWSGIGSESPRWEYLIKLPIAQANMKVVS
mgnify:CR=1 FL=1